MFPYAIRRLILALPLLFGITLISFFVIHLAPGDPASVIAPPTSGPRNSWGHS